MGMVLELRRVSWEVGARLLAEPNDVVWFLTEVESRRGPGFLARLFGAKVEPHEPREWIEPAAAEVTDLDKAWHCIHFLLTGDAGGGVPPAGYLLEGGHQLGEGDVGFGPTRALSPSQAGEFADLIAPITKTELHERYDPAALQTAEVYPDIWDRGDDEFEYVWNRFENLQLFMRETKSAGEGVIIYMM